MGDERDDVGAMLDALAGPEAKARLLAAIAKIEADAERIGIFANGGRDATYQTTDGLRVPSMQKVAGEHRTLRDWFAGQVALGAPMEMAQQGHEISTFATGIAKSAYQVADAMMAERAKGRADA